MLIAEQLSACIREREAARREGNVIRVAKCSKFIGAALIAFRRDRPCGDAFYLEEGQRLLDLRASS